MPWTAMHWVVFVLLLIIAGLVLVVIYLADRLSAADRVTRGAQPMPTRRQLRQWRRERLPIAKAVRR